MTAIHTKNQIFLLYGCIALMIVKSVHSCGEFLNASITGEKPCRQISLYANCLMLQHQALGLPFGADLHKNIGVAVRTSVKQACNIDCPIHSMKKTSFVTDSYTTGDELKVCAFDIFIASKARRRKVCGKIRAMVECILVKVTDDAFMLTTDALDVGTFITVEILKSTFGINCPSEALREKLFDKCLGAKQAASLKSIIDILHKE